MWIHIRWPLQSFVLLGFLFAVTVGRISWSADLAKGFIAWLLLCAGITVFNSYYDKDDKPVAGLPDPPPAARSMIISASAFKLLGLWIALSLNKLFLVMYLIGAIISVLYSHKNFRLKANGYVAVAVNFLVGAITFVAAISLGAFSGEILGLGAAAAGSFLASVYLMMQVHQKQEDGSRGDISIMVRHGRRATLSAALVLMSLALAFSALAWLLADYSPVYLLLFACYFGAVFFFVFKWLKRREDPREDFRIMNQLTMRSSYAANLILATIYLLEVLR